MRKSLRKKINPEKSNKMIYAVAIGLGVLTVALILIFGDLGHKSIDQIIKDSTEKLNKINGILKVDINIKTNEVFLVYDRVVNKDFNKKAYLLLKEFSRRIKEQEYKVKIYKNSEDHLEEVYYLKGGVRKQ